ncbi:hypothetical protein ACT99I_004527 [Salmonella enterica subsp. houtenae serovar [1],40:z4,z23:-]
MTNTHVYHSNPNTQLSDYKELMLSEEEIKKAISDAEKSQSTHKRGKGE